MQAHRDDSASVLSAEQERTLAAIADRIVPGDEYPSASQSGAVRFITRLLAGDLADHKAAVVEGLDRIETAARHAHASPFAELSPEPQDALLASIEAGNDAVAKRFFAWLVERVLEGYYADPANGGNDGAASWSMLGYDPRVPGFPGTKS